MSDSGQETGAAELDAVDLADLARARQVGARLPEGGLFHEKSWRVGAAPFVLPEHFAKQVETLGFQLHKFVRACNLLYLLSWKGKMPAWIAQLLDAGKPPELVELAREHVLRDILPGVLRPDVILTPEGFILSEIDNVPGGIGLTAWLNEAYAESGSAVVGGTEGMLEGFAGLMPEGGDIFVSEEAATYRPEMEWLAERLAGRGISLRVRGQGDGAPWASSVYRFFELFDLPNLPEAGGLLREVREGRVRLTPPPKAFLEEKLWFGLFWMKPLESFWVRELGGRSFEALRKCIPRTWILDPAPLPPQAVYPGLEIQSWDELKTFSQKQRQLVLKISGFSERAWGSRGVVVGHDVSQTEWALAVEEALDSFPGQPWILQEFHAGAVFPARYFEDEALHSMSVRVRLCPYYFVEAGKTRCGGILATLCPSDKKLLHGMSDAILVPSSLPGDDGR